MKVGELIALLEDVDQEAEARLAHQPSWPLAYHVGGVYDPSQAHGYRCEEHDRFDCEESECRVIDPDAEPVVWIVEGSHPDDSPYAPREAFEAYVS